MHDNLNCDPSEVNTFVSQNKDLYNKSLVKIKYNARVCGSFATYRNKNILLT
jgi:hypothetical protein